MKDAISHDLVLGTKTADKVTKEAPCKPAFRSFRLVVFLFGLVARLSW